MKKIFSILLSLSFFTALADINKDQLDELDAKTKYYLAMEILDSSRDSINSQEYLDSLVSYSSNKNIVDFFPFIVEDVILPNSASLDFSIMKSDEKAFRKQIIDNTNPNQVKTVKLHFMKYISNMANQSNEVQMSSVMYKEGKVYVVVAVLSTILIGIALYMTSLQKKISKLQKL